MNRSFIFGFNLSVSRSRNTGFNIFSQVVKKCAQSVLHLVKFASLFGHPMFKVD
jgi:hypothetical protein